VLCTLYHVTKTAPKKRRNERKKRAPSVEKRFYRLDICVKQPYKMFFRVSRHPTQQTENSFYFARLFFAKQDEFFQ